MLHPPAPHATALALLFDLPESKERAARALDYVIAHIGDTRAFAPVCMELYYMYFALTMLLEKGRADVAERTMRECWGHMKHSGAWTLWETLDRGQRGVGSQCHGWSSAPTALLMEHTLGVRPAAGKPNELLFAPHSATVTWARGTYPHVRGPVDVEWSLEAGVLRAKLSLPRGVRVTVNPTAPIGQQRVAVAAEVQRRT